MTSSSASSGPPEGHEHEFDDAPPRSVKMCVDRRCTELRVRTEDGWRELTPNEQTQATILMWEDLIVFDTMQIVHGKERGAVHARRVLGYAPWT